jgi:cell division protease FtsH
MDELCSLLGGRAAEELFLGQTSTGALNDLERVTKQVYAMVAFYGMSESLKNISYYDSSGRYDMGITKPYSDKTAELIDQECATMIKQQMERAKHILQENAEGHNQLAQLLIEKEVITSEDVERILGPRPWKSRGDQIIEANIEAGNDETVAEEQTTTEAQSSEEITNADVASQETVSTLAQEQEDKATSTSSNEA